MAVEMMNQPSVQYQESIDRKGVSQNLLDEKMIGVNVTSASSSNEDLVAPIAPCRIHDYIIHRAKTNPSAPAVQNYEGQTVTYAELETMAKKIAQGLQIQPKTIVPICMDTSTEFIATIIAVLMSGAAYVTLDPTGAVERNNGIVEDSNASIVVVDQVYAPLFTKSMTLHKILAEQDAATFNPLSDSTAISDPAYLIYTSGITLQSSYGALLIMMIRVHGYA